MNNHSAEDYLDKLLNSVNGENIEDEEINSLFEEPVDAHNSVELGEEIVVEEPVEMSIDNKRTKKARDHQISGLGACDQNRCCR